MTYRTMTLVVLGALMCLGPACTGATIAAPNSVNPILLGPVKSIGEPRKVVPKRGERFFEFVLHSGSFTTDHMTYTESSKSVRSPDVVDFGVIAQTEGDATRTIHLDELHCNNYVFAVLLVGYLAHSLCKLEGHLEESQVP